GVTPGLRGTCSATPLVAGVAALVLSANAERTAAEVVTVLKRTAAKDLAADGYGRTPPANFDPDPTWDVCAPGPGTTSCNWRHPTLPGASPYSSFGGTSAATPHVGGCLGLLAHACRRAGQPIVPARVQEALENTAVRVVGQTRDKENHYGAGRVDVYAAFRYGQNKGWW